MVHPKIRENRIQREKEELSKVTEAFKYQWKTTRRGDFINFDLNCVIADQSKINIKGTVWLRTEFPFLQPLIKLKLDHEYTSIHNIESYQTVDYYYRNRWTPKMTIVDIISGIDVFCKDKIVQNKSIQSDSITSIMNSTKQALGKSGVVILSLLFLVFVRYMISLGPYSGYNDPPNYGDYEAQRHWMELTYQTPPHEWYVETESNDLKWWRIDYPPLSAFASQVCGYLSNIYEPESMELVTSRGYETQSHKLFMRGTVLVTDIIFFFTAVYFAVFKESKKYSFIIKNGLVFIALLCPPFILIDHGHFQYNSTMLGFMLFGVYLCSKDWLIAGSIAFTLAFNFKQLGLYFALPFFVFILGRIIQRSGLRTTYLASIDWMAIPDICLYVFIIGATVLGVCCIIWLPWLADTDLFLSTLKAIFPVQRGLYQLKVANFWCFSNIFIKWNQLFSQDFLVIMAIVLTLGFSLPSLIITFIRPKMKYFKLAIFNVALAFFFFSYHVHEKTILLPLAGLILNIRYFGRFYFKDFVFLSCVTLYPLLKEDGLVIQYISMTLFYAYFAHQLFEWLTEQKIIKNVQLNKSLVDIQFDNNDSKTDKKTQNKEKVDKFIILLDYFYKKVLRNALFAGIILTHIAEIFVKPPERFPYLYSLSFAMLGFIQFGITFIQSNLFMIREYQLVKKKEKENLQKED